MTINFISNLPAELRSGGFSAMNAAALDAVRMLGPVHFVGPVNPPYIFRQKTLSAILRKVGLPGSFSLFSRQRLKQVAAEVAAKNNPGAVFDFFHGFTPWIATSPARPYAAWSGCTFRDYMTFYHRRADFSAADLERIEQAEAAWLQKAQFVAFTSEWGARRAQADYALDPDKVAVVGIFGEIDLPAAQAYAGAKQFAFVSTNFAAKGGPVVLAAFRDVRKTHRDASLVIVGDGPADLFAEPGVQFVGFLKKENPDQAAQFRNILATSLAVVHPTKSDIAPLLIVEAGYFGTPVISSRLFAIPELVEDGKSGILLDDPGRVDLVAGAMRRLLDGGMAYNAMRDAAWEKARGQFSKQRFSERLCARLKAVLP